MPPTRRKQKAGSERGEINCALLSESVGQEVSSFSSDRIQSLWAGYGEITRIHLEYAAEGKSGEYAPSTIIAKVVHPQRGETGEGHERKLKSYQVEACFYAEVAPAFLAAAAARGGGGGGGGADFAVPRPLHVRADGNDALFLLSDIGVDYPQTSWGFDAETGAGPLAWLAAFHAAHWGAPPPPGLWPEGSYWRFETRREEWRGMRGRRHERLKRAAPALDRRCRGLARDGELPAGRNGNPFWDRTLCHGDAKSTNIQLSSDGRRTVFYDFQYCGGGYGARDLAYFFCAGMDADAVEGAGEEELLRSYHRQLTARLPGPAAESFPFEALLAQFELCLADYTRFMAGWGMWGNSDWAERRTEQILDKIDGGTLLSSQDDYFDAVYLAYPLE